MYAQGYKSCFVYGGSQGAGFDPVRTKAMRQVPTGRSCSTHVLVKFDFEEIRISLAT